MLELTHRLVCLVCCDDIIDNMIFYVLAETPVDKIYFRSSFLVCVVEIQIKNLDLRLQSSATSVPASSLLRRYGSTLTWSLEARPSNTSDHSLWEAFGDYLVPDTSLTVGSAA